MNSKSMFKILWLWLRGKSVIAAAVDKDTVTIFVSTNSSEDTKELMNELNRITSDDQP